MKGLTNSRTGTLRSSGFGNCYLFTGRRLDEDSGTYYFRYRYYEERTGRFLSRDLLKYIDGMNLYAAYFVPQGADPKGLAVLQQTEVKSGGHSKTSYAGGGLFDDSYLWYFGHYKTSDLSMHVPDPKSDIFIGLGLSYHMHIDTFGDTDYNGNIDSGALYKISHKKKGKKICCKAELKNKRHVYEKEKLEGLGVSGSFILDPVKTTVREGEQCEWRAFLQVSFSYTGSSSSGWNVSAKVSGKGAEVGAGATGTVTAGWHSTINEKTATHKFKKNGVLTT